MSTDIEKYLKDHRKDLDVESPDDSSIWEGIRGDITGKGNGNQRRGAKVFVLRFRNIAAIAIIALLVGYVINDVLSDNRISKQITLASINSELGDKENEYKELIKYKKEEIGSFDDIDNIIINELIEELDRLDTIYNTVLDDLNTNGYTEDIVNIIFDTYEKKIRILELIILETNKTQKYENEKNIAL